MLKSRPQKFITEHSTDLENEIYEKNQIMLKYLHEVEKITAAVEQGTFTISSLRTKQARQVAEIVQTDSFKNLKEKLKPLKQNQED